MAVPQASSWGDQGYYDVWLNEGNSWIYRHLHTMANRLQNLANEYKSGTSLENTRLLNQMLRELLLAQSSDWAFLITTQTAVEYSVQRTKEHISNFFELEKMINSDIDYQLLEELEYKNSIFDFCNYKIFCSN
jgi:1,4-alpha-glucan branching enzyme